MELELDLKITKNVDDLQSTDFRIAKDRAGPIFLSRETGTKFVLTAHLRGYRREDINIDINEDGTLISISGEKLVQEMAMKGWVMHKKEPNLKGFIKVFKIPKGVVLDQIKADYNDEEATLTIYMPKRNKGIIGCGIEEVKDENQVGDSQEIFQESQAKDNDDDDQAEVKAGLEKDGDNEIEEAISKSRRDQQIDAEDALLNQEISKGEGCSRMEGDDEGDKKEEEIVEEMLEGECDEQGQVREGCETEEGEKGNEIERSNDQQELAKRNKSKNKFTLCAPCFFIGSTLVASLIAFFVNLVRSKRK